MGGVQRGAAGCGWTCEPLIFGSDAGSAWVSFLLSPSFSLLLPSAMSRTREAEWMDRGGGRGRRGGRGPLSRPALRRRPRSASGGVLETRGRRADPRSVPMCGRVVQCVSRPDVSPARTLGHPPTRGRGAWSSPRLPPPAAAPSPLPHLSVIRAPAAWGRRWAGLPALPPQGPHLILLLSPAFRVAYEGALYGPEPVF